MADAEAVSKPTENQVAPELMVSRSVAAMEIVKKNMVWSVAAGLLPIPLVEFAAITAVQVKLIKELADFYNKPFRADVAKSTVVSLLGGLGSVSFGRMVAASSLRWVPFIGPLIAVGSLSGVSAAITYAVGRVYVTHFETGGTPLDLEVSKIGDFFRKEFQIAMKTPTPADAKATA
jgi:uncharacterized protein (DUF697 family)